ncbi:hypothetical protein DIE23_20335 [Burkholderia sp. Bp9143]|nr:hypothetical protein DIE23_20335 [Burkholderia sp. Bp9143]
MPIRYSRSGSRYAPPLDQFGLFGTPRHPVSVMRISGAASRILGVVLIRA